MSEFKLDTSGVVRGRNDGRLQRAAGKVMEDSPIHWSDLSIFTQKYIAMLFAAHSIWHFNGEQTFTHGAFTMLAPETLAQIIEDCEQFGETSKFLLTGEQFWICRQASEFTDFPPLTVAESDDGMIRFV